MMASPTSLLTLLRSRTAVDCDTLDTEGKPSTKVANGHGRLHFRSISGDFLRAISRLYLKPSPCTAVYKESEHILTNRCVCRRLHSMSFKKANMKR